MSFAVAGKLINNCTSPEMADASMTRHHLPCELNGLLDSACDCTLFSAARP